MSVDPNDPRIKQLVQSLMAQGHGGGKPVFGGALRAAGGGGGNRGHADYFKPGFAGINYNPLQAQMAQGAPGILGLASGVDNNPHNVSPVTPDTVDPAGPTGDAGLPPPVAGYAPPQPGPDGSTPPVGSLPPLTDSGTGLPVAPITNTSGVGSAFDINQQGGIDGQYANRAAYYASRRLGGGRY